jgi:hypothetical protein
VTDGPANPSPSKRSGYLDFSGLARVYARRRIRDLQRVDASRTQENLLRRLLWRAQNTRFGKAHGYDQIRGVETYQKAVPVREYAEFWSDWWSASYPVLVDATWPGQIPYFARTSGTTTGRSKFIPYTRAMRRAAVRGFVDMLCYHLAARPQSRLFGGAFLGLTGPTCLDPAAAETSTGAVSAIAAGALPGFLSHRVLPPPDLADLPDWQEKIRRLAPLSLQSDVRCLGGSPNWLLLFLAEVSRLQADATERLVEWYPDLELILHGGVNFTPYRNRFKDLLEGSHAETRELYSASEGVFAYADRGDGEGLRLHLDGLVFFEFVPIETLSSRTPARHWIGNVETGIDYALVISTSAGLWSYVVGDIVRFVDTNPHRLIVAGRVQQGLSAFGEHLIEEEIADAVASALSTLKLTLVDYSVGAVRTERGGHHLYLIELTHPADLAVGERLAASIDARLSKLNQDYAELRERDFALKSPEVELVNPGGFSAWMKSRRGLGGQNKVPRIISDEILFSDLRAGVMISGKGGTCDGT